MILYYLQNIKIGLLRLKLLISFLLFRKHSIENFCKHFKVLNQIRKAIDKQTYYLECKKTELDMKYMKQ